MANGAVDDALIMLVFYHDAVATVNQAGNISRKSIFKTKRGKYGKIEACEQKDYWSPWKK